MPVDGSPQERPTGRPSCSSGNRIRHPRWCPVTCDEDPAAREPFTVPRRCPSETRCWTMPRPGPGRLRRGSKGRGGGKKGLSEAEILMMKGIFFTLKGHFYHHEGVV